MSQHNINELQTSYSFGEYVKQYIDSSVSPLANAGQRFGINASGVKYIQKSCAEIFNINTTDNINDLLLELHINYNSLQNIRIINKNTKVYLESDKYDKKFTNDLLISDIKDDNIINNIINYAFNDIDKISDDSYITINNKLFTGFLKGRLNQENNGKLIYFQYDLESNILLHNITTKYFGKIDFDNDNPYDDWYIVYKLDYIQKENDQLEYNLCVYLYRLEWLENIIKEVYNTSNITNSIKNLYNFNSGNQRNTLFSFFNSNFENYDNFTYDGASIDRISFLNFIFNYNDISLSEKSFIQLKNYKIHISDNNIINTEEFEYILNKSLLAGYISKSELAIYFNNIQKLYSLYYQLYTYYNQVTFFNNDDGNYLYKYIIYKLYEYIKNEYNTNDNDIIYIPLTYTFNCFISDDNASIVYYIDTIYIKFLNDIINIDSFKNQIYYINKSVIDHTSIYKVHINYNNDIRNIINDINVNKLYTLPYLNKLNNWVIDEADTTSSISQNKYAGIKELFIYTSLNNDTYIINENNLNYEVLNISDSSILKTINCSLEEFTVKPKYFLKYQGVTVKCSTYIPDLEYASDNVIDFFKNSIIIAITHKDVLGVFSEDYAYDYVYSLWTYNQSLNKFELVTLDNDGYAYDPYNNMSVINREQVYKFVERLNTSRPISSNPSDIITDNNYLVIRNKQGTDYTKTYNNNYNTIFEYLQYIEDDGTNPKYNVEKFITDISDIPITNTIYPKYDIVYSIESIDQLKTNLLEYNKPGYKTYIDVIVNGENKISGEVKSEVYMQTVYKEIEQLITDYKVVEIGVIHNYGDNRENNCYGEYVFNKNVPTIDFKEVFLRNVNALNKVNVLSLEKGNLDKTLLYNGFIGTKHTDNKQTLYISTSESNINIGNDTLLKTNQINKFTKYDTFQIDGFNHINLINSEDSYIKVDNKNITIKSKQPLNVDGIINTNSTPVVKQQNNSIITYSTTVIPTGRINKNLYVTYNFDNNTILNLNVSNIIENYHNTLFVPIYGKYIQQNSSNDSNEYEGFYNSINLNLLLENTFGFDLINNKTFEFISNNRIISINKNDIIYNLLVFNDKIVTKENIDQLFNKYHVINYQLNITLVFDSESNKVYINFENNNIDTLNKTIEDNRPEDNASLSKILNRFNQMITGVIPMTFNIINDYNDDNFTPYNPPSGDSDIENADITNIVFTNVTTETINLSMDGTDSTPTNPDTSDIDPDIIPTISFVIDTNNSDMSQIDLSLN